MISKGVDYYAYLSSSPFKAVFAAPDNWGKKQYQDTFTALRQMYHNNRQIAEDDIGIFNHTGKFQWTAYQNNNSIANRYVNIAPFTGNMGKTNMGNMMQTPSIVTKDYAISYGFYDAGAGMGSLTNQDQSYVYVTDNYANWMGDLAKTDPAILSKPFATFALPAAHDSGMFDTTCVSTLLHNASFLGLLAGLLGFAVARLSSSAVLRSVINLAMTQKDTITTMLNLGVRYFDFRPGYCEPKINNNLYHQHKFIPGYPYASFLRDVLNWLKSHPNEIVVINVNFQGFFSTSMEPSSDTLKSYLNDALSATGTKDIIVSGDKSDLQTHVKTLLDTKKRLIFLNQVGASNDASKYDSYDDDTYHTTDVNKIIGALNAMNTSGQAKHDYTVLQLQGTANATGGGIYKSIATLSDASSPLMSTKANFDHTTYPWLQQHVANNLLKNQLVVFLNDFADNALANYASVITKQRM